MVSALLLQHFLLSGTYSIDAFRQGIRDKSDDVQEVQNSHAGFE